MNIPFENKTRSSTFPAKVKLPRQKKKTKRPRNISQEKFDSRMDTLLGYLSTYTSPTLTVEEPKRPNFDDSDISDSTSCSSLKTNDSNSIATFDSVSFMKLGGGPSDDDVNMHLVNMIETLEVSRSESPLLHELLITKGTDETNIVSATVMVPKSGMLGMSTVRSERDFYFRNTGINEDKTKNGSSYSSTDVENDQKDDGFGLDQKEINFNESFSHVDPVKFFGNTEEQWSTATSSIGGQTDDDNLFSIFSNVIPSDAKNVSYEANIDKGCKLDDHQTCGTCSTYPSTVFDSPRKTNLSGASCSSDSSISSKSAMSVSESISSGIRLPPPPALRTRRSPISPMNIPSIHAIIKKMQLNDHISDVQSPQSIRNEESDGSDSDTGLQNEKVNKRRFFRRKKCIVKNNILKKNEKKDDLSSWKTDIILEQTTNEPVKRQSRENNDSNYYIPAPPILLNSNADEGKTENPQLTPKRIQSAQENSHPISDPEMTFVLNEIKDDVDLIFSEFYALNVDCDIINHASPKINAATVKMAGNKIKSVLGSISSSFWETPSKLGTSQGINLENGVLPTPSKIDPEGFLISSKIKRDETAHEPSPKTCNAANGRNLHIIDDKGFLFSSTKDTNNNPDDHNKGVDSQHADAFLSSLSPVVWYENPKSRNPSDFSTPKHRNISSPKSSALKPRRLDVLFDSTPTRTKTPLAKVDSMGDASKRRIGMLRNMFAEKAAYGSGLESVEWRGVVAKLDFVETETEKQIDRLRNRLVDARISCC